MHGHEEGDLRRDVVGVMVMVMVIIVVSVVSVVGVMSVEGDRESD